jgi:hypothetical protein
MGVIGPVEKCSLKLLCACASLIQLGIARELTGRRRNRLFVYDRYLAVLSEGTEPPRG